MSDVKVGTSIEDAIKNSDWSSVSIALWPHIVEQMKLHSKNIFECEMVYDLAHISTVPVLYDDNNGTRKQVIIPMTLFTKDAKALSRKPRRQPQQPILQRQPPIRLQQMQTRRERG